jgi:signal transduction histidine kinase
MSQITDEIRLFARQSILEPRETDINLPIRRAVALVERQLADANVQLQLDLGDGLPTILADDNQLQQVILNLVTNARDAVIPNGGGAVRVRSMSPDGTFIVVEVTDDGIGIPPENLNDIFLPFFTTKREVKGLGLGLSISYGIIQRHSGTLQVTSEPGKGATFRIILPSTRARCCWEEVDCAVCRPGATRETCSVYTRDQGYFCWAHWKREGDEIQVAERCRICGFYRSRKTWFTPGTRMIA